MLSPTRRRYRQLHAAAVLLLIQGILMEGLVALALPILLGTGLSQSLISEHAVVFALPYLENNLYLMMAMSGIFAALRIIGAVGLLRNRLWALGLSLVNCVVTLTLMIFLLPAGLLDGVLSGGALVLILLAWLGRDDHGTVRTIVQ
ncbi:MAG: hypothetical protein ABJA94_05455 [Rhodoglobus sp.]